MPDEQASCSPHVLVTILGTVQGTPVRMLLDSGSSVTILNFDVWARLAPIDGDRPATDDPRLVYDLNGNPLDVTGIFNVTICIPGAVSSAHPVYVVRGIFHECILGSDFLVKHRCVIDFAHRTLQAHPQPCAQPAHLSLAATSVLPPFTQRFLDATARKGNELLCGAALIEPRHDLYEKKHVMATWSLVQAGETVPVLISNASPDSVTLYSGTTLASLHLCNMPLSVYFLEDPSVIILYQPLVRTAVDPGTETN